MTNHQIDNSCQGIGKVILWQYDRAYHLLLVIRLLNDLYNACIRDFWNNWVLTCLSIDTCSDFGAMLWGTLIGIGRPSYVDGEGETKSISIDLYRKLIKAELYFQATSGSFFDVSKYLSLVFQTKGGQCGVVVKDNLDMSITYSKTRFFNDLDEDQQAIFDQHLGDIVRYPLGIKDNTPVGDCVFGFAGQEANDSIYKTNVAYAKGDITLHEENDGEYVKYIFTEDISAQENTGWASALQYVQKTFFGNPYVGSFAGEVAASDYNPKYGKEIVEGSVYYYEGDVWVCQTTFVSSGTWSSDKYKFQKAWQHTTFISPFTLNAMSSEGFENSLNFVNSIGRIVATYNGYNDVIITYTDIVPDFTTSGVIKLLQGNKLAVSLDDMAAAEGKTIHSTATIGDIVRYLNGTLN